MKRIFCLICYLLVLIGNSGCASSTATTDLIAQARRGLALAKQAERQSYEQAMEASRQQLAALDAAFDADVKWVASGQLKDEEGNSITLSPDWVIQAHRGYGAARKLIEQQENQNLQSHAVRMDNLAASDEALGLASQLIILQWNLAEQVKQKFMTLQERTVKQEENDAE